MTKEEAMLLVLRQQRDAAIESLANAQAELYIALLKVKQLEETASCTPS